MDEERKSWGILLPGEMNLHYKLDRMLTKFSAIHGNLDSQVLAYFLMWKDYAPRLESVSDTKSNLSPWKPSRR